MAAFAIAEGRQAGGREAFVFDYSREAVAWSDENRSDPA
jgi:hypothetical protein